MEYQFAFPSTKLRPYVKQYWALDTQVAPGLNHQHRIIPTGLPEIIFYRENTPFSKDRSLESNLLINGQHSDFYDLQISGRLFVLSVVFQPHGLSAFMPGQVSALSQYSIPLNYVFKGSGEMLQDQLIKAKTFRIQVTILEAFLCQLLARSKKEYEFQRMQQVVEIIRASRGKVSLENLANEACLSRKQFERTFSAHIGMAPKKFLQTVRFQSAIDLFARHKEFDLTSLALECGYYDQSHCINTFKIFSGMSPKQFFKEGNVQSDFF
jgi:AraC-like DNA-binding protein